MNKKLVLVVDKEKKVLDAIKKELSSVDEAAHIVTTSDGFSALELLQESTFEVVITNFEINELNGLELLEAIRSLQPDSRVIMMADKQNAYLEEQARRLQVYHFFVKPFKLDEFKKVYEQALNLDRITVRQTGVNVLSQERYESIMEKLMKMNNLIGARCLLLADSGGHVIARLGNEDGIDTDTVIPLLGAGAATLLEIGKKFDGDSDAINLLYNEGKRECIYGIYIGQQTMLVITMSKSSSRLGIVWYYARKVAEDLRDLLNESTTPVPSILMGDEITDAFDNELDQLFDEADGFRKASAVPPAVPNMPEPASAPPPPKVTPQPEVAPIPEPINPIDDNEFADFINDSVAALNSDFDNEQLSFEQAVSQGLISSELINGYNDGEDSETGESTKKSIND